MTDDELEATHVVEALLEVSAEKGVRHCSLCGYTQTRRRCLRCHRAVCGGCLLCECGGHDYATRDWLPPYTLINAIKVP